MSGSRQHQPGRPDLDRHVGLISAIDRYDPTQGVKLKTYAEYKIRGAILDSLRQMDWAPRQQRKRARLIERAITQLEQDLRREPTEEEVAGVPRDFAR